MIIGIGLPATIPGVGGDLIQRWARKAAGILNPRYHRQTWIPQPRSHDNPSGRGHLASVADDDHPGGATEGIRGIGERSGHSGRGLSGGRLTMGLVVGLREDDFLAVPTYFQDRGRRFDEQITLGKAGVSPA